MCRYAVVEIIGKNPCRVTRPNSNNAFSPCDTITSDGGSGGCAEAPYKFRATAIVGTSLESMFFSRANYISSLVGCSRNVPPLTMDRRNVNKMFAKRISEFRRNRKTRKTREPTARARSSLLITKPFAFLRGTRAIFRARVTFEVFPKG